VNVHITENTLLSLRINSQDQQRKKEQQCSTFLNVTKVQYIAAINAGNHQRRILIRLINIWEKKQILRCFSSSKWKCS